MEQTSRLSSRAARGRKGIRRCLLGPRRCWLGSHQCRQCHWTRELPGEAAAALTPTRTEPLGRPGPLGRLTRLGDGAAGGARGTAARGARGTARRTQSHGLWQGAGRLGDGTEAALSLSFGLICAARARVNLHAQLLVNKSAGC